MPVSKKHLFLLLALLCICLINACAPPATKPAAENVPDIRILLGTITSEDTIRFEGTFLMQAEEAAYEFGENNSTIFVRPIENGFQIYNENRMLRFRNQDIIRFVPEKKETVFSFRSVRYQGAFHFIRPSGNQLSLVNSISLEEYLKSVVPAEIYTNREELLESAKAQAICARTYAISRMNARKNSWYDVHLDVRDQVYGSLSRQNKVASNAAETTQGIVLFYGDSLATVYYHSCCGGVLEDAHVVWNGSEAPYLNARQDVVGDSFACRFAPNFRWSETRTIEQIDSSFQVNYGSSLLDRTVRDTTLFTVNIQVSKRDKSRRASDLTVQYGDTTLHLNNYEIRRFLGWPPGRLLPSTLFKIRQSGTDRLVIEGGGAGHGVGMCQWGAMQMSVEGFRYYHILGKYFKGCYLKRIY